MWQRLFDTKRSSAIIINVVLSIMVGVLIGGQLHARNALAASSSVTFAASDDASVAQNAASTNYGTATQLINNNTSGQVHRTFLKFTVSGIPAGATITSAGLQLQATAKSSATANVKILTNNSWSESKLTYANAPAYNSAVLANGTPAPITSGPVNFNVGGYVTGNGTWSMVITQSQATPTTWWSKEGGHPPQVTLTYTVPITAPAVQVTAPAASSTVNGTQMLAATASGGNGIAAVQFLVDGVAVGSPVTSAPYSTAWNTASVADGSHTVTAVATDTAGTKTVSSGVPITVQNVVPNPILAVQVTAPTSNQTVSGPQQTIAATVTAGANPIASVQFLIDGTPVGAPVTTAPYSTAWDTTSLADGPLNLTAVVTDTAALTATSTTVPVTVKNTVTPVPVPPTIQLTSPTNNQLVSGTQVVTATATAGSSPIASVQFMFDGNNLGAPVTTSPYTTPWNTTAVADGTHTLTAVVTDTATVSSTATPVQVTVKNTAPPANDPVIAAAGDIACQASLSEAAATCRQAETAKLLTNVAAVLALGDTQYDSGNYSDFIGSYDKSWGQYRSITYPVPGNHEGAAATGYYQYFGAAAGIPGQGYYSYDIGTWHILAINSNQCALSGCAAGSIQEQWVKADLAAHPNQCTLAYWHQPRWASGSSMGDNTYMGPIYTDLYNANADVVLAGHNHAYERFQPMDPNGVRDDARGLQEIIVGTGGRDHSGGTTLRANSVLRNNSTFGVLKLSLHPASYDWQFASEAGYSFSDSGTRACH